MFSTLDQVQTWLKYCAFPVPHVAVDGEREWLQAEIDALEADMPALTEAAEESERQHQAAQAAYDKACADHQAQVRVLEKSPRHVELQTALDEAREKAREAYDEEELAKERAKEAAAGSPERAELKKAAKEAKARLRAAQDAVETAFDDLHDYRATLQKPAYSVPRPNRNARVVASQAEHRLADLTKFRDSIVEEDPGTAEVADQVRQQLSEYVRLERALFESTSKLHSLLNTAAGHTARGEKGTRDEYRHSGPVLRILHAMATDEVTGQDSSSRVASARHMGLTPPPRMYFGPRF